jgi:hypothetical protein
VTNQYGSAQSEEGRYHEDKKENHEGDQARENEANASQVQAARANIAEGTRLFALAGRPTKADFIKVYGPSGARMTWAQRGKAGVDAKHFQAALKAKS